jgi:S1-C subfamily serine protease
MLCTAVFALAATLASPTHAGWYVGIHGTAQSLSWKGANGQALDLSSKDGKGIVVVTIAPDGRDGLHEGDRITAVDGQLVAHVEDLVTYANAHMQDPAKLSVSRGGHTLDVALAAGALAAMIHPHP